VLLVLTPYLVTNLSPELQVKSGRLAVSIIVCTTDNTGNVETDELRLNNGTSPPDPLEYTSMISVSDVGALPLALAYVVNDQKPPGINIPPGKSIGVINDDVLK